MREKCDKDVLGREEKEEQMGLIEKDADRGLVLPVCRCHHFHFQNCLCLCLPESTKFFQHNE